MVNLYGLELETSLRRQQAERLAAAVRLGKPDRDRRRPAQPQVRRKAGELLLRLGHWIQGEAGSPTSDLAWE